MPRVDDDARAVEATILDCDTFKHTARRAARRWNGRDANDLRAPTAASCKRSRRAQFVRVLQYECTSGRECATFPGEDDKLRLLMCGATFSFTAFLCEFQFSISRLVVFHLGLIIQTPFDEFAQYAVLQFDAASASDNMSRGSVLRRPTTLRHFSTDNLRGPLINTHITKEFLGLLLQSYTSHH